MSTRSVIPHTSVRGRAGAAALPLPRRLALAACASNGGESPRLRRRRKERALAAPRASGPVRVLVVDDEAAIRLLCRVNLGLAGMTVLEAENGAAAIESARRDRPDLILLDVMMPEVDGWEVASVLSRDSATREIPIVFLSARSERVDQRRGLQAGAVGYVTKPFDPVRLGSFLQGVLERIALGEREALRAERLRELGPD